MPPSSLPAALADDDTCHTTVYLVRGCLVPRLVSKTMDSQHFPTIRVSGVVLLANDGSFVTVRKRGTQRFMLPGGKPEPGENAAEAAIREVEEELAITLDPSRVTLLGKFVAPAANEVGHQVDSTIFVYPWEGEVVPRAEIEAVRRLDPRTAPLPQDLAPLLSDHVVPALKGAH